MIELYNGDCLDVLKNIPDKSINLVLMDPPYNINKDKAWDHWKTHDGYVGFMLNIFKECERVLVDNGAMYFFHNDIYQISMLMEALRNKTNFVYNSFIILNKGNFRSISWKNPKDTNNLRSWFNTCEYCLYYVKIPGEIGKDKTGWDAVKLNVDNFKSLREYSYNLLCYIGGGSQQKYHTLTKDLKIEKQNTFSIAGRRSIFDKVGGKGDHFTRYGSTQWELPTKETYEELIEKFNLREWEYFREYEDLRREYEDLRPVHNLDTFHNNVWEFKRDKGKNLHPCQKPINILERIIKCSTNEGMTVLDPFMGSGSTGVACKKLNRDFIGIEKDEKYFNISKQRIEGDF